MGRTRQLRAGDLVEVCSREDILATLDRNGQLEALPFMPEMFQFCGRRFRVSKRAHKTCDTVNDYKGRRMNATVHLEGLRCDGAAHGGCQAGCLLYWKEAWLRQVDASDPVQVRMSGRDIAPAGGHGCTDADVIAGTQQAPDPATGEPVYVCQTTQVPAATETLAWWDLSQYVEDFTSGNVGFARMASGLMFRAYDNIIHLGIGLGAPMRWLYDAFQRIRGGRPYPGRVGTIPRGERTPTVKAELQPGDLVRVKSYQAILATCDQSGKNRGMTFDAEMVPYCGGTFRVLKKVTHIINEQTGKMQPIANPCIILDGVVCQSRYSACRLFCPRSVYPYWREIWLEKVPQGQEAEQRCPVPFIPVTLGVQPER